MIQALKLGFRNSTPVCSYAVNYRVPKFSYPPFLNLNMTSKRLRSSLRTSAADNMDVATRADVAKPEKSASKVNNGNSGALEDESVIIEKMTVQEIKTRLRSIGVPAKGAKHELISALKICMNGHLDGEEPSVKPTVVKASSKRKAKGSSDFDHNQTTNNGSDICEDENSIRAEKKVSSRINTKVRVSVDVSVDEPWTVLTHKKPQKGWTGYNPRSMRPPPIAADMPHIKLMSWNEKDVDAIRQSLLEGYDSSYWTCSVSKLGYSGTAIISRIKPHSVRYGLGIADHDSEGRLVTVEFDKFYLLSGYIPNSGDGLRRLSYRINEWDPSLSDYMKDLEKSKPVILTGDLNCAHQEIDIYNPAVSKFPNYISLHIPFSTLVNMKHGGRKTNKGWRLDYFLASESIAEQVHDSYILPDVGGSDHCPIGLVLKL
ncbi:apurinic endonuclease-redox protein [Phtheirospermum japonicum]|uniref:DNA-(apurinic or apyrimidinic site) endonuclease n=1 Tax=Phtheirospermum japonicum TaxID=374723 RepID=A0A830BXR2_9LAMI|nr:apurinic endonuclease-redox protein [Phtheirospermum japonicum]